MTDGGRPRWAIGHHQIATLIEDIISKAGSKLDTATAHALRSIRDQTAAAAAIADLIGRTQPERGALPTTRQVSAPLPAPTRVDPTARRLVAQAGVRIGKKISAETRESLEQALTKLTDSHGGLGEVVTVLQALLQEAQAEAEPERVARPQPKASGVLPIEEIDAYGNIVPSISPRTAAAVEERLV